MNELSAPRYIMPKSVSSCQHCDEHAKFQILLYVHYMIFSELKLDLFIQALLLDDNLALE